MKKLLLLITVASFMLTTTVQRAHAGAITGAAAAAIIKLGLDVYKAIPDASYSLTVVGEDGTVSYTTVNSCDQALRYTYELLSQGHVTRVTINSEHSTVNGSCRGKTYTPSDLSRLRDLL